MGMAKRMLEEGPAASADGLSVCTGCIDDYALQQVLEENPEGEECDFCDVGSPDEAVGSLRAVLDRMHERIPAEYGLAVNSLMYISAEGGYQGTTWDTWDLLRDELELELPRDGSGELFQAIVDGLGDETWCEADVALLPEADHLMASWASLCTLVKHGRRYFFLQHEYEHEDYDPQPTLSPSQILARVCEIAEREGLVRSLPTGTILYRARPQKDRELHRTMDALGPPPKQVAGANRMSPAGVPMLYCCTSPETAVLEVARAPATVAVGRFETGRDLRVLDLTALPDVPSLFDAARADARQPVMFLRQFARDISKPLSPDSAPHVEYVPTQVVSEFLRFVFQPNGEPLHGIQFSSAQHPGGVCLGLFLGPAEVGADGNGWIRLLDVSEWRAHVALDVQPL